jgi:hypothetical protein
VAQLQPAPANLQRLGPTIELSAPISVRTRSIYVLYIPIPGGTETASVMQSLRQAAAVIGADDVVNIEITTTCDTGLATLRSLLGWKTTVARGTAVRYRRAQPSVVMSAAPKAAQPTR